MFISIRQRSIFDVTLAMLAGVGRLMMDFGFGAFLEKFEAHFGKWVTKLLLALIGLAVMITCFSVVWSQFINPLIKLLFPSAKSGDLLALAFSSIWLGAGAAIGLTVGKILETLLVTRRVNRLESKLADRSARVARLEESMSASDLALEELIKCFADEKEITQETADSLLSLLGTEPKIPL